MGAENFGTGADFGSKNLEKWNQTQKRVDEIKSKTKAVSSDGKNKTSKTSEGPQFFNSFEEFGKSMGLGFNKMTDEEVAQKTKNIRVESLRNDFNQQIMEGVLKITPMKGDLKNKAHQTLLYPNVLQEEIEKLITKYPQYKSIFSDEIFNQIKQNLEKINYFDDTNYSKKVTTHNVHGELAIILFCEIRKKFEESFLHKNPFDIKSAITEALTSKLYSATLRNYLERNKKG